MTITSSSCPEEGSVAAGAGTGVMVVGSPFGSLVSIGEVRPVGKVMAPSPFEITVSPAPFVVSITTFKGLTVFTSPFEKVAVTGAVAPKDSVMAPLALDMTVRPARLAKV